MACGLRLFGLFLWFLAFHGMFSSVKTLFHCWQGGHPSRGDPEIWNAVGASLRGSEIVDHFMMKRKVACFLISFVRTLFFEGVFRGEIWRFVSPYISRILLFPWFGIVGLYTPFTRLHPLLALKWFLFYCRGNDKNYPCLRGRTSIHLFLWSKQKASREKFTFRVGGLG